MGEGSVNKGWKVSEFNVRVATTVVSKNMLKSHPEMELSVEHKSKQILIWNLLYLSLCHFPLIKWNSKHFYFIN